MFLGEASDLLEVYLERPDFEEFERKNSRIQEIIKNIQEKMIVLNTNHPLGQRFVKVDEETEQMFREFAEICGKNLK